MVLAILWRRSDRENVSTGRVVQNPWLTADGRNIGSIIFVMGFTYGSLIPLKLSGSIWSCQRKVLET